MFSLAEIADIPSSLHAYSWVPFVVVVLLTLWFSAAYVRHFWSKSDQDRSSAIITTIGIAIALVSAFFLPIDVFLVSFMKYQNGTFKEWATNATRETLENTVTNSYYGFYITIFIYTFAILPFVYFCYEEHDEDRRHKSNVCRALLYTLVFLLLIAALLVAGAVIPFKAPPQNATGWEKIEFMVEELYQNRGSDCLVFVVNVLSIYGMLNLVIYTSAGLASFPITMIKGFRSVSEEERILSNNQANNQTKINKLRSKQEHKSLSSREISALASLEEEESLLLRRSQFLDIQRKSIYNKCGFFFKIFSSLFGVIGVAFSLVLFISLLITNIDKLMNSLGYKMGYVLKENVLPNPLDFIMVKAQKAFPLDYVLFFSIVIFLVICTISGMRYVGIWCLCIQMYRIRPKRTPPQGLVMLCFILMYSVLAFHIFMFSVAPSYTTFGDQYYLKKNGTSTLLTQCTLEASPDDCVMTRGSALVLRFAYKAWIFAATYYWLTWAFLLAFVFNFIFILIRSRRSALEEAVDQDDFDDSYDDPPVRI